MLKVIGQFNDSYAPIADGVVNVVKNYAFWLKKKGFGDCYVVTPSFPGYLDNDTFSVLRYHSMSIPLRHPYRAGMAFFDPRFLKRLRNIKFDLIHAHSPFSSGRLGLKIARERNIPVIATFHSKYYDDFKDAVKSDTVARVMLKYAMEFYNKVDQVWTVSNFSVETLREYGYKGSVEVVGNGIDLIVQEEEIKSNKGFRDDKCLNLLYVGQQIWHKNLRLMINSLKILKESGIRFKMTMVGEGNAQQGIIRLVQSLGMSEDFEFTGKVSDREKLKSLYSRSDLFLLPSIYDTFSIVIREAAAMGCPSVVIKGSCAAENIKERFNGYLAENDDAGFAGAIIKAASDRDKLKIIGRNARASLYRSWESIVDEVAGRYSEIIYRYKKQIINY